MEKIGGGGGGVAGSAGFASGDGVGGGAVWAWALAMAMLVAATIAGRRQFLVDTANSPFEQQTKLAITTVSTSCAMQEQIHESNTYAPIPGGFGASRFNAAPRRRGDSGAAHQISAIIFATMLLGLLV